MRAGRSGALPVATAIRTAAGGSDHGPEPIRLHRETFDMLFKRERPVTSATLPLPAPLPSLREALARRAEVFGPFDADEAPAALRGLLVRCAAVLRGVADLLEPAPSPINCKPYEGRRAAILVPVRVRR